MPGRVPAVYVALYVNCMLYIFTVIIAQKAVLVKLNPQIFLHKSANKRKVILSLRITRRK